MGRGTPVCAAPMSLATTTAVTMNVSRLFRAISTALVKVAGVLLPRSLPPLHVCSTQLWLP